MPGDVDAVYRLAHEVVPGQEGLPAVAADPHGWDPPVAPRQAVSHVEGLIVRQRGAVLGLPLHVGVIVVRQDEADTVRRPGSKGAGKPVGDPKQRPELRDDQGIHEGPVVYGRHERSRILLWRETSAALRLL